jgi:hypothetical protein
MTAMEPFAYNKPGARVRASEERLELVTGVLLGKKTHTLPWGAVTGVSVEGPGGSRLVVSTAGRQYRLHVGVGAGAKIRDRLMPFIERTP